MASLWAPQSSSRSLKWQAGDTHAFPLPTFLPTWKHLPDTLFGPKSLDPSLRICFQWNPN